VVQLIRRGAVVGEASIVDSSLLSAWLAADTGATWQKYAGKGVSHIRIGEIDR